MAANNAANWLLDTSNFLGFEYDTFKSRLQGLALSNPKRYVELRNKVVKKVRDAMVEHWYRTIYGVLTEGVLGGQHIDDLFAADNAELGPPRFPAQKVSKISLAASHTINIIVQDLVNKLVSVDYDQAALKKLAQKSAVAGIDA